MRTIGLDVHRDFCEVAIIEDGVPRSAPRVCTTPEDLLVFAQSLSPADEVVLENTGNARAIAAILQPHVARVAIANALAVKLIAHARVKTDKIDARVLAQLLAAGFLPEVFFGDEDTRALRRRISRRAALVKQRTAAKNEIHAVLQRSLKSRPPVSDLFGKRGRVWLAAQLFVSDDVETVEGCLRQIDMLDAEVARIDHALAKVALGSVEIRRLMTIPGVDLITATALLSAIGDIKRFPIPRHLVSYLGLNPTVHQSGIAAARMGRISKAGSSVARWALVEAAWIAARSPGPLHAFAARIGARRGKTIAAVAVARKLAVLSWHLLSKEQDYAFARPSLMRAKTRRLELTAGAPSKQGQRAASPTPGASCDPSRGTSSRSTSGGVLPTLGRRLEGHDNQSKEERRGRHHRGAHHLTPKGVQAARQASAPNLRFTTGSPAPQPIVTNAHRIRPERNPATT